MGNLWRDLRYGLRLLRLSPGFTAVAVLTLALGIGANTAIFQLIDAIRLRTIPVKNPETLAIVKISNFNWGSGSFSSNYSQLTFPLWEQIQKHQQAFSDIAVWSSGQFNLTPSGEAHYVKNIRVSGDFFKVLGIQPVLGRLLSAEDDQPGCAIGPANISYAFWQRNFAGDPEIVGKRIALDDNSYEIVGVTPASFTGLSVGDTWDVAVPVCVEPILNPRFNRIAIRRAWWLASIGRLKPGWTLKRATAQMEAVSPAMLQETIPPEYDGDGIKHYMEYKFGVFPGGTGFSQLRRDSETSLWLLLGISGLVLLIACANLANLMLARATARERQLTIRLALGASRSRLIRELLAEGVLLASAGSAFGLFLAFAISQLLVRFISTSSNHIFLDLSMDWRLLAFTTGLAVLTTLLFGLAPAIRATRAEPAALLQSGSRGSTGGGRERLSLRRALVVSQVALSIVLLMGALLFARSLRNLTTLNVGFQQTGVLLTSIDFEHAHVPEERFADYHREILKHVRAIPGVELAGDGIMVPFGGETWNDGTIPEGATEDKGASWQNFVLPGYFKAIGTPLLKGRDFDEQDTATSPKVAIVNQAFVDKFFKGQEVIGKRFQFHEPPGKPRPYYEIVGLVGNFKFQDMHEDYLPFTVLPLTQMDKVQPNGQIVIQSTLPLTTLMPSIKQAMAEVNPGISLEFKPFKTQVHESLLQDELMATLSGFFGVLAALLAAIGLYGVISYMVVQRTKEIGVRMAIGANAGNVIGLILGEAGLLTAIGVGIGTILALASAQAAKSLLFGIKPRDPLTLVLSVVTLAAVAALASFLPAYRASRLDPLKALRYE